MTSQAPIAGSSRLNGRLVHISNRVVIPKEGQATAGGLDVSIANSNGFKQVVRLGWSGVEIAGSFNPVQHIHVEKQRSITYVTVDLPTEAFQGFYSHFSNQGLWPLFHHRHDIARNNDSAYQHYLRVNHIFAEAAATVVESGDQLMTHDYHLLPFGDAFRNLGFNNPNGLFIHIPAPSVDVLDKADPGLREKMFELTESLFGYDMVGVQTPEDYTNWRKILGAEEIPEIGPYETHRITSDHGRETMLGVFPVSIDPEEVSSLAEKMYSSDEVKAIVRRNGGLKGLGVDRMDYSKGLPEKGYGMLAALHKYGISPDDIHLLQIAPASREAIPAYKEEKGRFTGSMEALNNVFRRADGRKVINLFENRTTRDAVPRAVLLGLYRHAEYCLVTPTRDGMNLVAKEYIAAQNPEKPGILILSKFAGATHELKDVAILVDPKNADDVASGIKAAMDMSPVERKQRYDRGMEVLKGNTNANWMHNFTDSARKSHIALGADKKPAFA